MESGLLFSFQEEKYEERSQTSETKGKFDISFFSKGDNFSQTLRPRFTGYGLKQFPNEIPL